MTYPQNDKKNPHLKNIIAICFIILIIGILTYAISVTLPYANDWHLTYYPATRAFINGNTPYYEGSTLENPIWICILLAPFAIFPEEIGRGLLLIASVLAYYAAFKNAGISKSWIILLFLSPQVLYGINMGTIDAFILAAPVVHPILGFMIALSKPQIGIGFAIFLMVEWIRNRNFREMLWALLLGASVFLISLWLGMPFSGRLVSVPWNTSLFPYSILPGFALLIYAIIKRYKWGSIMASPMLAPYLTFHSWVTIFMVNSPYYLAGTFSLSWIIYLIWHYSNL